jgi:predicted dehydrogenase
VTREGLFHLESLALRREFTPVAAAGPEPRDVDGLGGCRQLSMAELFEVDLDLAIIATSPETRIETAHEFLSRGTSVLIEAGIEAHERESLEACLQLALKKELFCGFWQPELSEPDFLAAKHVASETTGAVRSARFIQHGLAARMNSRESEKFSGREDEAAHITLTVIRQRLAQLLQLVEESVVQIHSTIRGDDTTRASGSTILVEFESAATGLIDVDRAATTAIDTGWVLQMRQGGYHAGRQSLIEADGEVYELPVVAKPDDPYSRLAWLLRSDASARLDHSRHTVRDELKVADLMATLPG